MQNAANNGNLLSRNGGNEYTVPSKAEVRMVIRNGNSTLAANNSEIIKLPITKIVALRLDNLPDGMGKYGLLIISISTSVT